MRNVMLNRPQQRSNIGNTPNIMTEQQAEMQARQMLNNNPNLMQQFQQLMQANQGKSYWDIAYQLAKERGIDPARFGLPRR